MTIMSRLGSQQVTSVQTCTLCIVAGGAARPATLPAGVRAVTEEWLLYAAEQYIIPPSDEPWRVT